jgi:hypothetical protein
VRSKRANTINRDDAAANFSHRPGTARLFDRWHTERSKKVKKERCSGYTVALNQQRW